MSTSPLSRSGSTASWTAWFPAENDAPAVIHKAMRYSLFAGGKRIRPILALESAAVIGGESDGS